MPPRRGTTDRRAAQKETVVKRSGRRACRAQISARRAGLPRTHPPPAPTALAGAGPAAAPRVRAAAAGVGLHQGGVQPHPASCLRPHGRRRVTRIASHCGTALQFPYMSHDKTAVAGQVASRQHGPVQGRVQQSCPKKCELRLLGARPLRGTQGGSSSLGTVFDIPTFRSCCIIAYFVLLFLSFTIPLFVAAVPDASLSVSVSVSVCLCVSVCVVRCRCA